jgi:hypothetical protein
MPVIRIDDEVWKYLQQRARPFVDSPNDVLRRLLGLSDGPSSQVWKEGTGKLEERGSAMRNIRVAALEWFRRQLSNPNSPISKYPSVYGGDFNFYRKYIRTSKYFPAGQSYPGIPVWWLQIPLEWVLNPSDRPVWLVCQKEPNDLLDFWCLAVPIEYLNSEYGKGNLGTLGANVCLHLSTENCTYRGYEVKMFDDVRLTMLTEHRPVQFGQFLLGSCT